MNPFVHFLLYMLYMALIFTAGWQFGMWWVEAGKKGTRKTALSIAIGASSLALILRYLVG